MHVIEMDFGVVDPCKHSFTFIEPGQTVQIQIRCHRMRRLIRVSTICFPNIYHISEHSWYCKRTDTRLVRVGKFTGHKRVKKTNMKQISYLK